MVTVAFSQIRKTTLRLAKETVMEGKMGAEEPLRILGL